MVVMVATALGAEGVEAAQLAAEAEMAVLAS